MYQETAKLDALIEEQRRLIDLLKEKRQAKIALVFSGGINHEAVTVGRVRDAVAFVTSGPLGWSDLVGERGALFFQSGNLDDDLNVAFENCERVQVEENPETLRTQLCDGGVLACITGAKTGNVAFVNCVLERAYVNQHVRMLRPNKRVLPRYLALALKSTTGQSYFEMRQYGMKQGLILSNVQNAPLSLPSLKHQGILVRKLDSPFKELDRVESAARMSISLLQERRFVLIFYGLYRQDRCTVIA